MKIGILTQPLLDNYGGLLQAYALKEVLHDMGHEVLIINRQSRTTLPWRKYAYFAKSLLIKRRIHPNLFLKATCREELSRETRRFSDKYIPNLSQLITDNEGMQKLNNMDFDAYIVGSDQCWRPRYSPAIQNYFLDFAVNDSKVKRIAYAASFGVSHWEFSNKDTLSCKALLQKFDAISVREDSATDLIKKHLGRNDAQHVLDPTMLLSINQYKKIVDKEKIAPSPGNLKVYVLDKTHEKDNLVMLLENKLQLKAFEVLPPKRLNKEKVTSNNINDFVFPNPAAWLRGFQDAKFVVTDSFHGTVFSILHNIPFIAIGNERRGLSRFQSLLKMFRLEDRLVTDINSVNIDNFAEKKIDWVKVYEVLEKERKKSVNYLRSNLR